MRLGDTKIRKMEGLNYLKNLVYLYLNDTPIEKLENYENMTSLSYTVTRDMPNITPADLEAFDAFTNKNLGRRLNAR